MAELDLSLSDALADAPQTGQVESLVERDFMAQLEAETFDDQVGETVGKTDYIPLLDNVDTRAGCKLTSGGQITVSRPEPQGEVRPLPLDQKQAVATDFLSASMAGYIDPLDSQSSPAQMMDTGLMGAFSGFSQPGGKGVKVEVGAATLQADRPPSIAEPQHATPPAGLEAPKEHGPMLPEPQVPRSPADLTAVKSDKMSEKKEENLEDSVKKMGHFEPLNKADERGVKVEYESTETPAKVEKEMEKETQKDTEKEKEVKIEKDDEKVKVTEEEKVKAADKQAEKVEEMKKETEKGKEKEKVESMQQKEDKMTKAEESLDKSVKTDKVEKVENKAEKMEKVEKIDKSEKVKVEENSENKNNEKLEKTAMKDDKEHIEKVEKTPESQSTAVKFDTSYDKLEKEADREAKVTVVVEETKKEKADVDKAQKIEKEGEPEKPSDKPAEQPEQKSEKQDQIQAENKTVEKKDDKKDKAVKADGGEKAKKLKPLANGSSTTPIKDLAGADKKTKPGAGLTKPSAAAKMRPSSAVASSGSLAAPIKRPTPSSITSSSDKKATTARAPSTATAGLKRPSTGSASRPLSSTTTTATRDVKPKTTIERRPLVPKASTATSNQTGPTAATKNGTATTAASKTTTSVRTSLTARTSATAPKKPLVPKTNSKPGEEKKPITLRTSAADSTKPKTTTRSAGAPTTTTTTASRTRIAAAKPATPSSSTVPEKKPTVPRAPRAAFSTSATAASKTATRPSTAPAADTRNVRSKIGSTDNMKHQPGGGKVSASQIRAVASKDTSQGKVQILSKKVDLSKVTSKCGSKDNIKYKPGGGDVKIGSHKVNFREKAQSKAGSTDNLSHSPGEGNIKAEGVQETTEGNETPLSGTQAPAPSLETGEAGDLPAHENGLKDGAPCESESLREPQALDSSIPETN